MWECLVVLHAWIVSNYWRNRAEGNRAEFISLVVSDKWEGDPEEADFGMLFPTVGSLLLPFIWMLFD